MKLIILGAVMACQFVMFPAPAICQEKAGEQKLHMMATGATGGVRLAALSIQRGGRFPSVIQLKGEVEIRWRGMILRADEAEYHEDTGEIEARGNVRVKPLPWGEAAPPAR